MNPWLETFGVILIALSGILVGKAFSCLGKHYWLLGYLIPSGLIASLVIVRCATSLAFVPPFCWMVMGRAKYVILSLAVTMGLTTPLGRLPYRFEQLVISILMIIVVCWFSLLPFIVPAFIREHLSNIETRLDSNGICFQSTDYTCAPAAAVTALRKLGLAADEGEIAILSHTSPVAGTLPACLQAALEKRYGGQGLKCYYRRFDSIDELRDAGVTLAVVKDAFLSDHCVAVLEVTDRMVTLADPVTGREVMSLEQFEKIWRHTGIVLNREQPGQTKSSPAEWLGCPVP